jgi:hypothetical protein
MPTSLKRLSKILTIKKEKKGKREKKKLNPNSSVALYPEFACGLTRAAHWLSLSASGSYPVVQL